jgi:hypothetical protein
VPRYDLNKGNPEDVAGIPVTGMAAWIFEGRRK